jgi:hypothetical protein
MAPRRGDRFQSARQMREALREAWEQHLEHAGARGQRRWARRARYAGALGLVAVGMMLPVPSAYDHGLARLLGRAPSPVTNAGAASVVEPVMRSAAAAVQAAADVAAPQPAVAEAPRAELPQADALAAPVAAEWDPAQAAEASAQAIAASEAVKSSPVLPVAAEPAVNAPAPAVPSFQSRRPLARQQPVQAPTYVPAEPVMAPAPVVDTTPARRVFGLPPGEARPVPKPVAPRSALVNDYTPRRSVPAPEQLPDNPYGD